MTRSDLPQVEPLVRRHRRLACRCAKCGKATSASVPQAAQGSPFGHRIHALALYLKTNQLFSYQRLQGVFRDLFGLDISQGALMNMFKRTAPIFAPPAATMPWLPCAAHRLWLVTKPECGSKAAMAINGFSARPMLSCILPYSAAPLTVVRDTMAGHQPDVWISDRYSGPAGHEHHHQNMPLPISTVRRASSKSTAPTLSVCASNSGWIAHSVWPATSRQ